MMVPLVTSMVSFLTGREVHGDQAQEEAVHVVVGVAEVGFHQKMKGIVSGEAVGVAAVAGPEAALEVVVEVIG